MRVRKALAAITALSCTISVSGAQIAGGQIAKVPTVVDKPGGPLVLRPYRAASVPPVELKNSDRLHQLIRAGKLYLTLQDAISLAIENNLDLEVDRYGPLTAEWNLERSRAGGALRGVTGGNSLVNQATNGQGVVGSEQSAGVVSNNNGNGNGGGSAVISQIGPVTQNLDAVLQSVTLFSHTTQPQANSTVSQTSALISGQHVYQNVVQQGLLTGGYLQVSANESYLKQNAPTDILNPSVAPVVQIYLKHNLLNSFGVGVNSRFIRVAEKNTAGSHEVFRSQLLNVVANVLNLYWDLVADEDTLKVRQRALSAAQKFYDDTKSQVSLGVLAGVEIFRAQGELATRKRELAIAEADVRQQENLLKTALVRDDVADPVLDLAPVVPLDAMHIPEQDDLPPLRQLVARALANRPDVALDNLTLETGVISAEGTANGLLPYLQVIAAASDTGLAGTANPHPGLAPPNPDLVGGIGTALEQIARRSFPNERVAVQFQGIIQNRQTQGDYGVDQLQLRQTELVTRRSLNQLVVDISNQVVALRQARARYGTAADARILQEQLLEREEQRFRLGGSKINDLITAEEALVTAQAAEVTALSLYSHARVALDQVLGETLEKNQVSSEKALALGVARN